MTSHPKSEGLLARILSWIPGMVPQRYSIVGLLSSRYLKEWIRYAKRVEIDVRRRFSLIPQWICASQRSYPPLWLFFVQVMHFCIFRLVNSVSTSPSYDLIDCTHALQAPTNIYARHSMVNRVLGEKKQTHWCIWLQCLPTNLKISNTITRNPHNFCLQAKILHHLHNRQRQGNTISISGGGHTNVSIFLSGPVQ